MRRYCKVTTSTIVFVTILFVWLYHMNKLIFHDSSQKSEMRIFSSNIQYNSSASEFKRFEKLMENWPDGKPKALIYFLIQPKRMEKFQVTILWRCLPCISISMVHTIIPSSFFMRMTWAIEVLLILQLGWGQMFSSKWSFQFQAFYQGNPSIKTAHGPGLKSDAGTCVVSIINNRLWV